MVPGGERAGARGRSCSRGGENTACPVRRDQDRRAVAARQVLYGGATGLPGGLLTSWNRLNLHT